MRVAQRADWAGYTAARGSNVPGFHLAAGSGAGLAMLPAVYAGADTERVRAIGLIPELDYPAILPAHKNVEKLPRASAVFEYDAREWKPMPTRGETRRSAQRDG
jgi:DNA-binding transcriptional LysR family regulator